MMMNNQIASRMSIREIKATYNVGNEMARKLYPALNTYPIIYKGRPLVTIFPVEWNFVYKYKSDFNVGFDFDDLYVQGSEYKPPNEHYKRFVAKYVNQSWHTDLHYTDRYYDENFIQYYLIAFIDDRSRKILYHEILPTKTMEVTSAVLQNCLNKYPKPKTLLSITEKNLLDKIL